MIIQLWLIYLLSNISWKWSVYDPEIKPIWSSQVVVLRKKHWALGPILDIAHGGQDMEFPAQEMNNWF